MTAADEAGLLRSLATHAAWLRGRQPGPAPAGATVLSRRADRLVVRYGDVVLKAHPAGTDPHHLAARLRLAARPALREILLAPLDLPQAAGTYAAPVSSRLVSAWPAAHALSERDADSAPWADAGTLLARLHRVPISLGDVLGLGDVAGLADTALPPATVVRRLPDRIDLLRGQAGHPLAAAVLAAWATLAEPGDRRTGPAGPAGGLGAGAAAAVPPAIRAGRPVAVIHGDWHFGQLVALPGAGWRLIDVDDLGLGDPAWDLARPAAWFAAGLLPVDLWARFVDAYAAGGGPAVTDWADPWPALDLPARFRTVEYAATAVAAHLERPSDAGLDPVSAAFVDSCARIAASHGPESGS